MTFVLKGLVKRIKRTGELIVKNDMECEKCIFTVLLTGFSKREGQKTLPDHLKGKKVEITRYCYLDWHYQTNVLICLTPTETENVLKKGIS